MPELQRDLSEPSTDRPTHPGDISMDGKFQGIMHALQLDVLQR